METRHSKETPFCLSVKGHVKLLRLVMTVASMTFFVIAQAPEPYIVITGFEVTVIVFFIALYMCRLDKLMKWLFWPLLDIVNSLVTTLFMLVVSVLALIPETTTMTILGGRPPVRSTPSSRSVLSVYREHGAPTRKSTTQLKAPPSSTQQQGC
ncbi:chemokine-like factor isoform X1 [Nannospalax galili]|uniref:chemokine-like factor isoform X1 n=1 Tax=Nannospalax galili TaxID=1026970 RepID=UPI00111C035E|nr:chemokine-like factor isoform X1 [Nannospalax galili]